jgi:CRISPR-associated protein Cas2
MHTPNSHASQNRHSHAQRWVLAHDIRDPKRLQRVWRYLRQEGVQLQYSVYLLACTRHEIQGIIEQMRQLIDERRDDVRIYPLTENTRIWSLGSQFNDSGNTLCDVFMDKLQQSEAGPAHPNAESGCRLNV